MVVSAALVLLGVPVLTAGSAQADTQPAAGVPATASAKALPTWQINGVGWAQVVVGNTVYVTGNFVTARPPGVPVGGAGEVSVGHLLAYDIRTGNRISSFNHVLNAQGRSITVSPDQSRIYVGGDFTTVDGQTRSHIAAFDAATGALVSSFAPTVNGTVLGISVASNGAVYFGGDFNNVAGSTRHNLAAVNASNGSLRAWAPSADATVWAILVAPNESRVIVGGQFGYIGTSRVYGHTALDATTGAVGTWLANDTIHDDTNGAIGSLCD